MTGWALAANVKSQYCPQATALTYVPKSQNALAFNTYADCYTKVLSKAGTTGSKVPSSETANIKKFVQSGGFEFLSDIEKKFKCAGFCQTPLFYMT